VLEQVMDFERVKERVLKGRLILVSLGLLWVCSLAGFACMVRYDMEEGSSGSISERWPSQTHLVLEGHGHTLIVFLHPQCPCSTATVTELAKIVDHSPQPLKVYADIANSYLDPQTQQIKCVGEVRPGATRLVNYVSEIPGVEIVPDAGNKVATAFGAETSGYTMLYDQEGKLAFAGGITASRGHEGDNDCADLLIEALKGRSTKVASSPVFGCKL
jgi:hypothetical protein